ncbi:hypothetical protein ACVBEJ_04350 [Porticoccus sp. GXU_MW_L64]
MNMKKSLLLAVFFLAGCNVPNNMIGYEMSFDKPIEKYCVDKVLQEYDGVESFKADQKISVFEINKYEVEFEYEFESQLVSGYTITIDGMWLGEEIGDFYRNAEEIQRDLHKEIKGICY